MELNYIGADIAYETFVIGTRDRTARKGYTTKTHKNTDEGVNAFISTLNSEQDCIIMEATGVYHLRLAYALCEHNIKVCVCNPLSVRRFAEMKGRVAKTDELDAFVLLEYGEQEKPCFYEVPTIALDELRQRRSLLGSLQKRLQMSKNNLHHFEQHPKGDLFVQEILMDEIAHLEEKIKQVQEKIAQIINDDYEDQMILLKSIPGIGDVMASSIIDAANSFQGFEDCNVKQFAKHAGLCPNIRKSGKSVRGASSITRSGTPDLRAKLFLPAMTVATRMKDDNPFRQQYLRLRENGKSFKVAIVAVMHKMLRVAIAVLKSKQEYDIKKYGVQNFSK
jgi:transposase